MDDKGRRRRIGIWTGGLATRGPSGLRRFAEEIRRELHDDHEADYLAVSRVALVSGVVTVEAGPLGWPFGDRQPSRVDSFSVYRLAEFDAVLSVDPRDEIWEWPLGTLGVGVACFLHDVSALRSSGSSEEQETFFKALRRATVKADLILCISAAFAASLRSLAPETAGKLRVIAPGVRVPTPALPAQSQGSRGANGKATILMIGSATERANHVAVLAAAPKLAAACVGRRLCIALVGDAHRGAFKLPEVHSFVLEEARRSAEVVLAGPVSDAELEWWYGEADIVVEPDLEPSLGLTALEALMRGIPLAASLLSGVQVLAGDHAVYFDPYDLDDLAMQVGSVIARPSALGRAEAVAGALRASRFGWPRAAADLRTALRAISSDSLSRSMALLATCVGETRQLEGEQALGLPGSDAVLVSLRDILMGSDTPTQILRELLEVSAVEAPGTVTLILAVDRESLRKPAAEIARTVATLPDRQGTVSIRLAFLEPTASYAQDELAAAWALSGGRDVERTDGMFRVVAGPIRADRLHVASDELSRGIAPRVIVAGEVLQPSDPDWGRVDGIGRIAGRERLAEAARRKLGAYFDAIAFAGGLAPYLARSEGRDASATSGPSFCLWAEAGPFAAVEDGLDRLVVIGDVGQPHGKPDRDMLVVDVASDGVDGLRRLALTRPSSLLAVALFSRCVIGPAPGTGALSDPALIAAALAGRDIVLVGAADSLIGTLPNVRVRSNLVTAMQEARRHALERAGSPLPPYPPGWSRVIGALKRLEERQTIDGEFDLLFGLLQRVDVRSWGAELVRRGSYAAEWGRLLEAVQAWRSLVDTSGADREATSRHPEPGREPGSLAEALRACGPTADWADTVRAWRTGRTEQLSRLNREDRFDLIVLCGAEHESDLVRGFDDLDCQGLDDLSRSNLSVLFAGGTNLGPVPASRWYMSGPIQHAGPALAHSRFGLVPRLSRLANPSKLVACARRCLTSGLVTLCPEEERRSLQALFPERANLLVAYSELDAVAAVLSGLRRAWAADAVDREPSVAPRAQLRSSLMASPALSLVSQRWAGLRTERHLGGSSDDVLALAHWRTEPLAPLGRVVIALPALADPHNPSLALVADCYAPEIDGRGRAFRWLGPRKTTTVRLPATFAGKLDLTLRVLWMGECGPEDVSVLVDNQPLRLAWTREDDVAVAKAVSFWPRSSAEFLAADIRAAKGFTPQGNGDNRVLRIAVLSLELRLSR